MEKFRKKKHFYLNSSKNSKIIEKKLLKELQNEENKITSNTQIINKNQIPFITKKNFNEIKLIRKKNYNYLKKNINKNFFDLKLKKNNTPLFFFLKLSNKSQRDKYRNKLKLKKIFCPIFWKIKNKELKNYPFSNMLTKKLLAIPIDHRITKFKLKYITNTINSL